MRVAALITLLAAGLQSGTRHIVTIDRLDAPVCAIHDTQQDVYFVANINGAGTAKDNNGYISRVTPDGRVAVRAFIKGGQAGVTLNAPKGLAIMGRALWVADIDVVRAFDRVTGRPLRTVDLSTLGAIFLNEMAVGPDRSVYVTDTSLKFTGDNAEHIKPDHIFRITEAGEASMALEGDLEAPSGIAWDASHQTFIITALQGHEIFSWSPGSDAAAPIWRGLGGYDGIVLDGNRWLVSSLDGKGIYEIQPGLEERIIDGLTTPAAIGFDARRRRLLIPSFDANTLQIWQVGPARSPLAFARGH